MTQSPGVTLYLIRNLIRLKLCRITGNIRDTSISVSGVLLLFHAST